MQVMFDFSSISPLAKNSNIFYSCYYFHESNHANMSKFLICGIKHYISHRQLVFFNLTVSIIFQNIMNLVRSYPRPPI